MKIIRSTGFPSSSAAADIDPAPPIHCEGSRVPAMNSQITVTHEAGDSRASLAGSKNNNADRQKSHSTSATKEGIVSVPRQLVR